MWIACALLEKNSRFGGQGHQGLAQLPLLPMLHLCAAYEYRAAFTRKKFGEAQESLRRLLAGECFEEFQSSWFQQHLSTTQYHSVPLSTSATWSKVVRLAH